MIKCKEFTIKKVDKVLIVEVNKGYKFGFVVSNSLLFECIELNFNLREINSIVFSQYGNVVLMMKIPSCNIYYIDKDFNGNIELIMEKAREQLDTDSYKEWLELYC